MRVLITGSRSWNIPAEVAESVVVRLMFKAAPDRLVIVHGGCDRGIDAAFDKAARDCGAVVEVHPADWDDIDHPAAVVRRRKDGRLYDANAGPRRNQAMVDLGAEMCVGFSEDLRASRGTSDCLRRAILASIPTYLCVDEDATPRRLHADDVR